MLEAAKRCKDLEGTPRTVMQTPIAFFEEIEQKGLPKNRYVGEIYLAWHRGTLTAQARTKRGNRKAEFSLRELEFFGCMAFHKISRKELLFHTHSLWKRLLFHQFHDILPGTSIERVHQEAEENYHSIIQQSDELCGKIIKSMISEEEAVLQY